MSISIISLFFELLRKISHIFQIISFVYHYEVTCFFPSWLLLLLSHFSHVRLCDLIDGSPPGSPVPEILQARTPEWVAIATSNSKTSSLEKKWGKGLAKPARLRCSGCTKVLIMEKCCIHVNSS